MKLLKLLSLLFFVQYASGLLGAEKSQSLIISGQDQFDNLDSVVKQALKQGVTDLTITLTPGLYFYGEKHLNLSSVNYPQAKVSLIGERVTLLAKDLGKERSWQDGSFNLEMSTDVDRWTALVQSPDEVLVIDAESKLCRIRTPKKQKQQSREQCKGMYLQLTEWYDSKIYPVVRCERRYIYFTASDLEYLSQYGHWNVNADVAYAKVNPRFRTIKSMPESAYIRYCQASTFLSLWHSTLHSFTMRGITFGPNNGSAPLVDTDMFKTNQLLIERCVFRGVRGLVVKVWFSDNVIIRSNDFEGCYAQGIESYNGSRNTQVVGNTFRNHGQGLRQNFGIVCRGEDFLIKANVFRNFSYTAIGVGVWYGHKASGPITGVVSENDISFDQKYYDAYAAHTLMDGGAIYTWTKCDKVEILGNKINRYRGMKDYRGIFCDDGGKNIAVRDNTVTNIGGGSWCIDLRWVDHVSGSVPDHNTGNTVSSNTVDGRVRFETRKP